MIDPTNDATLPFAVLVERPGNSKGPKFYSGSPTQADATALAAVQNERERMRASVTDAEPEYLYTVVASSDPVVAAVRERNRGQQ